MQITRETDHAINCIQFLTKNWGDVSSVTEIASTTKISKSFIAKILQKLAKASLIESVQGKNGGFVMRKAPDEISLYDVVVTIQGPIALNKCVVNHWFCENRDYCSVHPVFVEINQFITKKLQDVNFAELQET